MPGTRRPPHYPPRTTPAPDTSSGGSVRTPPRGPGPAPQVTEGKSNDPPSPCWLSEPFGSRARASRNTTATPPANRDTAAAPPKPAPKCPGATHPPTTPPPAANTRGEDRIRPDLRARTAFPDSGNTKSVRSPRARPEIGRAHV